MRDSVRPVLPECLADRNGPGSAYNSVRSRMRVSRFDRLFPPLEEGNSDTSGSKVYTHIMNDPARVVVVLPAYNAAKTLERTYADIPKDFVSSIILVDDVSQDQTVDVARSLVLSVVIHIQNRGYGGNQKTCYLESLRLGADIG